MSKITKIIKAKKSGKYFVQREDSQYTYSYRTKQYEYKAELIPFEKLVDELEKQFEAQEGVLADPISADEKVLKKIEKKLNERNNLNK